MSPVTIDTKVTARGEVMRLLQAIRFYSDRALTHEDIIKREASVSLVLAYAKRLVAAAREAELR